MYVIRDGKKRARGQYLRLVHLFDGHVHYCHTKKQGRAVKFATKAEAERMLSIVASLFQEAWLRRYDARVVRLKKEL